MRSRTLDRVSGTNDDEAWRSIVENYGDRPQVEDLAPPAVEVEPKASTDDEVDRLHDEPERFVPPEPPPLPRLDLPRHLPWVGVFGVPALLLVLLLAGVYLPTWLGYLMVSGFVGSFVYLVFTMQRGGRDPFDDGARL